MISCPVMLLLLQSGRKGSDCHRAGFCSNRSDKTLTRSAVYFSDAHDYRGKTQCWAAVAGASCLRPSCLAAFGKKGLSLHAVEMKTVLFDSLFLYEWVFFCSSRVFGPCSPRQEFKSLAWTAIPNRLVSPIRLAWKAIGCKWMPLLASRLSRARPGARNCSENQGGAHGSCKVHQRRVVSGASAVFALVLLQPHWSAWAEVRVMRPGTEEGAWVCAEMKEKQTRPSSSELALLARLLQTFSDGFLISSRSHYKVMKNSYQRLWWTRALRTAGEKLTTVQSELADCSDTPSFLARSPLSL